VLREMEIDWVVNQDKFTTATDFEETLKLNSMQYGMYIWIVNQLFKNHQIKNWKNGFSRLVRKNKGENPKTKNTNKWRHLSEEGIVQSLHKNPLRSKVKVRFKPGSSSDGSAATKARSRARSSNVDGGDEIRRP